jgi:hypothetical protein
MFYRFVNIILQVTYSKEVTEAFEEKGVYLRSQYAAPPPVSRAAVVTLTAPNGSRLKPKR